MMEGRPLKFRLLEIFSEKGHLWNYEVMDIIAEEYKEKRSKFGRQTVNWDLIELAAAGFIKETDAKVDEEGIYNKGVLLREYGLTTLGRDEFTRLESLVKPRS
jgi:hypothetical protein